MPEIFPAVVSSGLTLGLAKVLLSTLLTKINLMSKQLEMVQILISIHLLRIKHAGKYSGMCRTLEPNSV